MSDDAHARVALDLLAADVALTVFDGVVPNPTPPPPYILVYSQVSWSADAEAAASNLGHEHLTCRTTWYLHCVGASAAAARVVAGRARAALLDRLPLAPVPGRSCDPISEDDANPPTRDETLGFPVMDAVVVVSMTSVPG